MSSKYSYMSDAEFVRFAQGMVGDELYSEALQRLENRLDAVVDITAITFEHHAEVDELEDRIGFLESRIETLEFELEHA